MLRPHPFKDVVTSEEALSQIVGEPSALAKGKQLAALDTHCRHLISLSPFVLVGTTSTEGRGDISPRGDIPGFVLVLDDATLLIPERPGNRRVDTLRNIVQTGQVGLLFVVPGLGETLRVNGAAWVVQDKDLLERMAHQGKPPLLAIGVQVQECYLHCAKAFKRSHLWEPEHWPDLSALPTIGQMIQDQLRLPSHTAPSVDEALAEDYVKGLY